MESYGIPIIEKYSLMLKTLPYYSYTHNGLLLLSCFSQKSRKNLKDNYKAFLICMDSNLMEVKIENENIERRYSLPCDLFKFRIIIRDEDHATYFKKWIVNISEDQGFYFISNSFHHRISLTELTIQEDLIERFIPYIETMKSLIIHNCEYDQSLLDIARVSSDNIFDVQEMNNFIRKYANIPNPITKLFNKIDICKLYGDHSKKVKLLKAMKKVPLYVKCIEICSNNEEELENLTDPNLHLTPINNLKLRLCDSVKISSKTIKNLQSIYPNSITLSDDSDNQDEASHQSLFENFIKLLSKLNQTSLDMDFD